MEEKKTIKNLEIVIAFLALATGIALVVFSVIDIPTSMLWQAIWGTLLIVLALIYMVLYARSKRK